MTVRENLEMGAYQRKDRQNIAKDMDHVFHLFPRLKERVAQRGGTLSGGEQQMLSMGRALMAKPKIMLLDEPSMGLAPILVDQIFDIIKALNSEGTTILLVEQNARIALSIANRGYVLETGEIVLTGEGKKLLDDPQVKAAYLGEGGH
jgi:branched-chain amino acid transport system ATP-binding protein